jgi:TnpA family transposase
VRKLAFFRRGGDPLKKRILHHAPLSFLDWDLIASLVPDMMRVAVSIRTGSILPSDILRRLNSSSRKNKLYFGFRELGGATPQDSSGYQQKVNGSISSCNGSHSVEIA